MIRLITCGLIGLNLMATALCVADGRAADAALSAFSAGLLAGILWADYCDRRASRE